MSGTTTNYGFQYPDLDDDPNGPIQMQTLADGIDTKIHTLETGLPTSHALSQSGLSITMNTGWSTAALVYWWLIDQGEFRLNVDAVRSGATLTASSGGGLANTLVFTIAAPYQPRMLEWGTFTSDTSHGGAHLATNGQMYLTDAHPNSTIATSDTVHTSWRFTP